MTNTINFMVGGEAGQGVQTIGYLLTKSLARYGYQVFSDQDYESRVRGGHNFFRVRASQSPVNAINENIDILIAFNLETIALHRHEVVTAGIIIYDSELIQNLQGSNLLNIPAERLVLEATGGKQTANTVLLAAALAICGYEFASFANLLEEFFGKESAEKNIKAADSAYKYVEARSIKKSQYRLKPIGNTNRMILNGNEAMALGAIAAGCKFMAAYPMTPVTPIMEYMAAKSKEFNMVVVPAEDEIAAINMVVGAGYAGIRAMTATSGGGFCLMVEGLGLAGMTETPIVVIEGQRPGPTIGLPTRQEQSDLQFVLHASHGEFPRMVLAPSTVEECFWSVEKAFNLADKYQLPVIVMTDHHLATSYNTVERFDLTRTNIDRGSINTSNMGEYQRHLFTENGISPRAFPGKSTALVVTDSDEHDENGHLTEDPAIRTRMTNKRLGKMALAQEDIQSPKLYGPEQPDMILVGWGSTFGAIREAVDILNNRGKKIAHLHFHEIWPFPKDTVKEILADCPEVFVVESNATGQLAQLIRQETCIQVNSNILRYDGRPMIPSDVIMALHEEVK